MAKLLKKHERRELDRAAHNTAHAEKLGTTRMKARAELRRDDRRRAAQEEYDRRRGY